MLIHLWIDQNDSETGKLRNKVIKRILAELWGEIGENYFRMEPNLEGT